MGRPRLTQCKNGHDLTSEGSRRTSGGTVCLRCWENERARLGKPSAVCEQCGGRKFLDRRRICFGCTTANRDAAIALESRIGEYLRLRRLLEDAPSWVRNGTSSDKMQWLGLESWPDISSMGDNDDEADHEQHC